jgi:hypothetical protein
MTDAFEDRERGFEAKFAHDEEFRFRLTARRDKLLARWAAARLHLSPDDEAALVAEALGVAGRPGPDGHDAAVLARIGETLARHGKPLSPAALNAALLACADDARAQLLA